MMCGFAWQTSFFFFLKLCNRNICEKSSSAGPGIATKEGQQLLAEEALLEVRKKKCFKEQYAARCIVAVHQDGFGCGIGCLLLAHRFFLCIFSIFVLWFWWLLAKVASG